jgi:hypothetical protein
MQSIVLDFDGSVRAGAGSITLHLGEWQEAIRFGCRLAELHGLDARLPEHLPIANQVTFLGSGDFHHVSALLVARALRRWKPLEVVVLDNHPDNMRYLFGIHCGSWVRHVASLPGVEHVHVLGITSADVAFGRLWENYLGPLWRRRLTYWCVGKERRRWPGQLPFAGSLRAFRDAPALLAAFGEHQRHSSVPVYLSIDKDVLSPDVVATNWDQGQLTERDVHGLIDLLRPRVVASDITGDVSMYRYRNRFKRWLAARDAQPSISGVTLAAAQEQHAQINESLLRCLAQCPA